METTCPTTRLADPVGRIFSERILTAAVFNGLTALLLFACIDKIEATLTPSASLQSLLLSLLILVTSSDCFWCPLRHHLLLSRGPEWTHWPAYFHKTTNMQVWLH